MDKLTIKENWDTYRYQIMDGSIPVGETTIKSMAYMFAASPDMYEALNALVRAYNNMSIPELCKQHELWQAAENALLKAEAKEE